MGSLTEVSDRGWDLQGNAMREVPANANGQTDRCLLELDAVLLIKGSSAPDFCSDSPFPKSRTAPRLLTLAHPAEACIEAPYRLLLYTSHKTSETRPASARIPSLVPTGLVLIDIEAHTFSLSNWTIWVGETY